MKQSGLYRRYLNRIVGVLGTLFVCYMICSILNYMYVDAANWGRVLWHDFYENDGKIDHLYLGSSHVFYDIDPTLLDDMNGQYNFELSSLSQRLNGSYYLLREADKNNMLSHVYLELFYNCSTKDNFHSDADAAEGNYPANWQNTDCMKATYNKLEYICAFVDLEKYADTLFPFIRYRAKLDNWDYIRQTIEAKKADEYRNYEYHFDYVDGNGYIEYQGKGYWYNTREFFDVRRLYQQDRILDKNPIGEKSEKYLRMIISYCQEKDIPITLFVSPMDELMLISTEHYDNYIDQVREIAEEYGVEFYDFNLVKEEYLDIQHGEYFFDIEHLNYKGADIFTPFFGEIVSGIPSENEKYFYSSYEEKLRSTPLAIYGVYYRDSGELRTCYIASNRENGMEYRIMLTPDPDEAEERDAECVVLQDYSENKEFILSVSEHGSCTIEARIAGETEPVQALTIGY